jgi:glucokinase
MAILALDVGGTKVAVGRGERSGQRVDLTSVEKLSVKSLPSFNAVLDSVGMGSARGLAIGVAGPVLGRSVSMTNLPWIIDADQIERERGIPVTLVNDLEAYAQAISYIAPEHFLPLQGQVTPLPKGTRALIAAGTGLGEAISVPTGYDRDGHPQYKSIATEGGHSTFAPVTQDDIDLLRFLKVRYDHVSWERVVSGTFGFRSIYEFLISERPLSPSPELVRAVSGQHDIGAAIIEAALAGEAVAREVITMFVRLYGAEAGNLALKCLPYGGVYIAGGIALRIEDAMKSPEFLAGFHGKGRFGELLKTIPIAIVKDHHAALRGLIALGSTS